MLGCSPPAQDSASRRVLQKKSGILLATYISSIRTAIASVTLQVAEVTLFGWYR